MADRDSTCLLISDFTIDNLAGYLTCEEDLPAIDSIIAPFDQVIQTLMNGQADCWQQKADFAVVWTRPERTIGSFKPALSFETIDPDRILEEVDGYASLLLAAHERVRFMLVPTWVVPYNQGGSAILDMKSGSGIANTLMRMNLKLAERIYQSPDIYLLDAQKWTAAAGKNAYNPKLWYMGKIAFGNDVFKEAARDIKASLRGINGKARKLIVLDLDDTLWGGIVGDVGWENIKLGGHDYIGEAYADFQHALKALKNRGILLAIVSKNEESVAMEALAKHPEMVLRPDDFAGWRINWQDKAKNVADLVAELNLGLQSVVFIDDNPAERGRVKEALSEVFVPEWPEDRTLYKSALLNLRCFDTPSLSSEDLEKTQMYATERRRRDSRIATVSYDKWLKSLETKVTIEELNKANLQRTAQLLNKTNQMNLTTRRMTEQEIMGWAGQSHRKVWTVKVVDKFGASGLTGIISLEVENGKGKITDFVLSCRVMGRKIEETMLYQAISYARSLKLETVCARYIPTAKNKPCLEFWQKSGFTHDQEDESFVWDLSREYSLPDCIEIEAGAG